MGGALRSKQVVPLSDDERESLQTEAALREMTTGLLTRALVLYGLERLGGPAIERQIREEQLATQQRISDGAKAAANARWGNRPRGGK